MATWYVSKFFVDFGWQFVASALMFKTQAWAQAFEIYIRKAVQLEYKIPKDADGSPQLVLNMKLMIQAGAECALHCHRISASK